MKAQKMYVIALLPLLWLGMALFSTSEKRNPFPEKTSEKRISMSEKTSVSSASNKKAVAQKPKEKSCVFKSFFGEEAIDSNFMYKTPARVSASMEDALRWVSKAQHKNGGWGAGSHARQDIYDPQSVKTDPASTAMVAMALLRCGNTPTWGPYSSNLQLATNYLLEAVEKTPDENINITTQTGTQPQIKLGQNIDVVLTSQYFTNLLDEIKNNPELKSRVKKALDVCVSKIQSGQNVNGSQRGAGWAGVLQSSLANNALETAQAKGARVDDKKLEQSRNYQKGNYDAKNKTAKTDEAAGVLLYSISGSARASAKEARVAKEKIAAARREGKIAESAPVTTDNLVKAGMSESDALKYNAAYEINQAAKQQAQQNEVMNGFGSNGGEEFLSFLQTGEGLIMAKDIEWKKWYDNVSGKLVRIQNEDGSWNGHHCITSPVFCTATSLLILSVNNDVEHLMAIGGKN